MKYSVKEGHSVSEMDPQLLPEWDYEKNILPPDKISYGSGKKVHWICSKCFSSFQATPNKRHYGRGCPYCAGQKVKKGYNDLATVAPLLAEEWDYNKNKKTPAEVTARGGGPAYWKCSVCGHEWGPVNISDRYRGTGCPQCKKNYHTSLAEQIIFYYIKKDFPDAHNNYKPKWIGKFSEVDIYIPSLRLAIEYDGEYWHKNKIDQDRKKGILIKAKGIKLIRIREGELPGLQDGSVTLECSPYTSNLSDQEVTVKNLYNLINDLFLLNLDPDVDIIRDYPIIVSILQRDRKEKSLAAMHPEILADWDYKLNGDMRPEQISFGSSFPIHWKCHVCGNSWVSPAYDRHKGHGCAVCAGKALLSGKNDLLTLYPDIAKEWDYIINGELLPEKITASNDRKVSWICSQCGYSWNARVADRTGKKHSGCPRCAGRGVIKGEDDFGTLYPRIAIDWDWNKNKKSPYDYRPGSNQNVFWKCHICGHEWHRPIVDRVIKKTGCKSCASRRTGLEKRINNMVIALSNNVAGDVDAHAIRAFIVEEEGEGLFSYIDNKSKARILKQLKKIREDIAFWKMVDSEEISDTPDFSER